MAVVRSGAEAPTRKLSSKNGKMRALSEAGRSCAEIAQLLGVSYQRVYNVVGKSSRDKKGGAKPASNAGAHEGIRNRVRLKLDAGGRVLIPANVRDAMGIGNDNTVLAWLDGGELRLVSPQVAMRQAQQLARDLIAGSDSLADEVIAERRQEAKREAKNG